MNEIRFSSSPSGHAPEEAAPLYLHGFFERIASRHPDRPAVVAGGATVLHYGELEERSNQLARHLQSTGAGPEVRVGIALDPGVEMLVAMFGVLKSGAAYVPIDPLMPSDRMRMLVEESGAALLIACDRVADECGELACPVLCPGRESAAIASLPTTPVTVPSLRPESLAYVIFTSGSTGRPKGVMIPHSAISAVLAWRIEAFPFTADDRVLQTLSFTFDASLWQFFHTLGSGSALVFLTPEERRDPNRIVETLKDEGITILGDPPSVWKLLLRHPDLEDCKALRMGFCGGEPLTEEVLALFFERLSIPLHNVYGPTETSMEASAWTGDPDRPNRVVTIGHAIPCASLKVLDSDGNEVAEGAEGELFIGGSGVGRGYLNDPALTASRFVPDPHGSPGARMYRTGDRVQRLPDGSLAFCGRDDEQIKLHGHRIELGEIDAALAALPGVAESIVVLREDRAGDPRLVGYVVLSKAEADVDRCADLRALVAEKLPAYMVPQIVAMKALPRNAAGKVVRDALPAPLASGRGGSAEAESSAPLERFLRELWEEVLGTSEFGDEESFFDIGGNSIHVAVLIHKMQERLGEFVYTVALYDAPSINALAEYLRVNYAGALSRLFGSAVAGGPANSIDRPPIDEERIETFQSLVRTLPPREPLSHDEAKNPPAVFVLSPPRSGSTLLRIMLGGHPRLFSPPELQLLNYNTLTERKAILDTERDRFWLEGTVRAIMEIRGCDAGEAERLMAEAEAEGLSVKAFYRRLQEWLGEAIFAEKTPTYPLDPGTLRRAEEDFAEVKYIHLLRHPSPMISSFDEAKLHVFFPPFLRESHTFPVTEMAELVWNVCHRNILNFLDTIPEERRHRLRFEDLVKQPEIEMRRVAEFLDLEFHPDMANPYAEKEGDRMTDALHPLARMLGDVKFHSHGKIRAEAAERKQGRFPEERLGQPTRELAGRLGYVFGPKQERPAALMKLQPKGNLRPFFCVHPAGGSVSGYRELARLLGEDRPFYAFRSVDLDEGRSIRSRSVEELATDYIEELREAQPQGPYHLGGWSLGGIVALEMALQLREQGETVDPLILVDSHLPARVAEGTGLGGMRDFLEDFTHQYGISVEPGDLSGNRRDRLEKVYRLAVRGGVFPADLPLSEFRRIYCRHLAVFRNHVHAGRRYLPDGEPPKFVLMEASDPSVSVRGGCRDWGEFGVEPTRVILPGNHFTILRMPGVEQLASHLSSLLESASARNRQTKEAGTTP